MKITANKKTNREIDIVVEMEPLYELAATSKISQRNLPANRKYSEEQLQWYDDLVVNILAAITGSGFNIIEEYQSSESYSYYITFEAFTSEGESLGNFKIKLRISDHYQKKSANNKDIQDLVSKGRNIVYRSITVNGITVNGIVRVTQRIWHICDELLAGNIDVLDELGR